jgi:hypothetical protein
LIGNIACREGILRYSIREVGANNTTKVDLKVTADVLGLLAASELFFRAYNRSPLLEESGYYLKKTI